MTLLIEDYEQQYSALIAKITAQISHLNIAPRSESTIWHTFSSIFSFSHEFSSRQSQWTHPGHHSKLRGSQRVGKLPRKIEILTRNWHLSILQLEQISLEIRDAPPDQRSSLTNRVNCYEVELKRLQQEFTKCKNSSQGASNFESDDDFDDIGFQDDSKRRLLDNSERLERTGKNLEEGYRIVLETESLGNNILQDLSTQRETIQRSRSRVSFFQLHGRRSEGPRNARFHLRLKIFF